MAQSDHSRMPHHSHLLQTSRSTALQAIDLAWATSHSNHSRLTSNSHLFQSLENNQQRNMHSRTFKDISSCFSLSLHPSKSVSFKKVSILFISFKNVDSLVLFQVSILQECPRGRFFKVDLFLFSRSFDSFESLFENLGRVSSSVPLLVSSWCSWSRLGLVLVTLVF